jgi:hypothetical protein
VTWPTQFTFLGVNVNHIDIDGSDEQSNGFFLSFNAGQNTKTFTVYGCQPNIRIKRDYALSGQSAQSTQTITDRTNFVIPPPVQNPDGSWTSPPL